VESAAISKEIVRLEGEIAELRARVDEDNSSFSSLEQQIGTLKERLSQAHDAVRGHEAQLAEKRAALAEAQRLERLRSYQADVAQYREARDRVGAAADTFLAELEAYDGEVVRLRKFRDELQEAFGSDESVAEVDAALGEEADELMSAWKAVAGAAEWRIRDTAGPKDAASTPAPNGERVDDAADPAVDENRAARIREYSSKS
jgi:chromosome segregation ATPase